MAAEKYNNGVRLGRDEAKQEHVLCAAVVAFEDRVSEKRQRMKLDFLVSRANQMVDNVG